MALPHALAGFEAAFAEKTAKGQAFRLTDFLHQLLKLGQQAIDTPEERLAIATAVLKFYDENVNAHVPTAFRDKTRQYVLDLVNQALSTAATF